MTAQQYHHFPFLCFLKFPRSNASEKKKPEDRILPRSGFIQAENTTYQSRQTAPAPLSSFVTMTVNTSMEQSMEHMM